MPCLSPTSLILISLPIDLQKPVRVPHFLLSFSLLYLCPVTVIPLLVSLRLFRFSGVRNQLCNQLQLQSDFASIRIGCNWICLFNNSCLLNWAFSYHTLIILDYSSIIQ